MLGGVDDFAVKLRIVRFLRTPEYDQLFSGDPTWVTESIGGIGEDGRPLVTRTSFRYLQTPPPPVGRQMQFFGARVNLAKALLYAITAAVTSSPANRSVPPARR
ncbi:pyruvate formate lyase family protein [Nonomuraea salmonea]|uniref:pyruvate formate lyase family protein n=1 Tax=Nonomuraea salmonea TaxID=46181 RepID=UPI002FE88085